MKPKRQNGKNFSEDLLKNHSAVVYTVDQSERFRDMVVNSIRSLRTYNSEIDVLIINTGDSFFLPEAFQPLQQIRLKGLFHKFPDDKCLIGTLETYENLIYLDSDTFLVRDVSLLFSYARKSEIAARLSWTYQSSQWAQNYAEVWRQNLITAGADYVPVFNSGVIVFQKYSHVRMYESWRKILSMFHGGELLSVYGGPRLFEQLAFSIATSKNYLSYILLDRNAHSYAWNHELSSETIVFHTTSKWYDQYKPLVARLSGEIS